MPELDAYAEQVIRETANFIWEREGRPEGCAQDYWERAAIESSATTSAAMIMSICRMRKRSLPDDANMPALSTKDVPGD
jgi:hypothetical protein